MSEVVDVRRRGMSVDTGIVLALAMLLVIVPAAPPAGRLACALAVMILTTIAWLCRAPSAASLGLLFTATVLPGLAGLGPQQVVLAIALAIHAFTVRRTPWLIAAAGWWRRGVVDRTAAILGAAVVVVSAIALLAWYRLAAPDLADIVGTFVPDWPVWLLAPGAGVLAVINAATEEAAYRGVLLDALDRTIGRGPLALVLQAAAFGMLHVHGGFPRGPIGVALAFIYGLALGGLCRWTRGLLAPLIVHAATDVVIFSIVLTLARG